MESFAKRLIRLRTERGLSQNQLAKQAGVSAYMVKTFESGNIYRGSLKYCLKLVRFLNITLAELFADD
ncbi:MAG: helix-turn-helix transcriptional regulator [Firmicutes bacterium]|nr:helix-turn-helix transcriptional regulator [Bacillota bacterium]